MIRVGLVGLGEISRVHLGAIDSSADLKLACVIETRREHGERVATERGCPWFPSLETALATVSMDVVAIALPHDLHASAVRTCLQHRVAVLCEKPLALTGADARALATQAERSSCGVVVRMYQQYLRPVRRFLELIRQGDLGSVHLVDVVARSNFTAATGPGAWHGSWTRGGGGVLMENGSHFIDLLLSVWAAPTQIACATSRAFLGPDRAEDAAVVSMRWGSQRVALLALDWADMSGRFGFRLHASGSAAAAEVSESAGELVLKWWPRFANPAAANGAIARGPRDAEVLERQADWWWQANLDAVSDGVRIALAGGASTMLQRAAGVVELIDRAYAADH